MEKYNTTQAAVMFQAVEYCNKQSAVLFLAGEKIPSKLQIFSYGEIQWNTIQVAGLRPYRYDTIQAVVLFSER
jgi:hypothetical protein